MCHHSENIFRLLSTLSLPQDDTCLRLLINEVEIMVKHPHKNIVRILGIGAKDPTSDASIRKTLFLVQENLTGGNLKKVVMEQMINYHVRVICFLKVKCVENAPHHFQYLCFYLSNIGPWTHNCQYALLVH